ncbi:PKD domain protein [Ostertagia ostertagi]
MAQLQADFQMDKTGGCSPLTVGLTNTSSGASSNATYLWDLGNGNTSTLINAGATYVLEETYTITLTVADGNKTATQSKKVTVYKKPTIDFSFDVVKGCLPQAVNFTAAATPGDGSIASYFWDFGDGNTQQSAGLQKVQHTYNIALNSMVGLTVTNSAGCYSYIQKPATQVLQAIKASFSADKTVLCNISDSVKFSNASSGPGTLSYYWDFGDGSSSNAANPTHTYNKKASSTTICGNTPVTFTLLGGGGAYNSWDFGDGFTDGWEYNSTVTHQYTRDSVYTVSVAYSSDGTGLCRDTTIKKDFIKVLPPFPKINHIVNTCDGERNLVSFTDTSYKALSWDWDFGDGSAHIAYNAYQPQVQHVYAQTGKYKVVLTNTNGQCSVRDSSMVYVLLKQHPVLSSNITSACSSGPFAIYLKNMETNPAPNPYFWYGNYYGLYAMQYGDTSNFSNYNGYPFQNGAWQNTVNWTMAYLDPTKKDLRIISNSAYFGCNDTSNFIPVKINGPKAGFKLLDAAPCFEHPILAQDTSIAGVNAPITSWNWDFGDGKTANEMASGTETHSYASPGQYMVRLTVTDINGCKDQTLYDYSHYANPSGPQAAFVFSPANVTPGVAVSFTNNTNQFNSSGTQYKWLFGDGSSSTGFSPVHIYNKVGVDTVQLIAINPNTNCQDTSIQVINVRLINTHFSFTKSFVTSSSCPPVIVHFTNTSSNALSVAWDFGDGSRADNQNNPSHTYYTAGTYKITMYGYGYNGTTDTTVDSIVVKAPSAKLNANAFFGCRSKVIRLDAQVTNASFFVWDFGDGQVQQTRDSFATHPYLTPGIYSPALILYDSNGCSIQSYLQQKIVIDSLAISIKKSPAQLCGPGPVNFQNPVITSFAQQVQQPLQYHWDFGTGNAADTSNAANPSFVYSTYGTKLVQLTVQSPFGCSKQATDSILVLPLSIAAISGPLEVCEKTTVQFNGSATINDKIGWHWDFGNGNVSTLQNPLPQNFPDTGSYKISLVINHYGCPDTAISQLTVHANPVVKASPQRAIVCLGNSIQLNATAGNNYSWSPANGLNNNLSSSPVATPADNTVYVVTATNNAGCSGKDSISLTVLKPFTMKIPADTFVCKGSSIVLPVSGANSYHWIKGNGLSDLHSPRPVATPIAATGYTVVGYDAGNCFTDTGTVHIDIQPLPFINAGPDIDAPTGTIVQLNTSASQDVNNWNWSPPDYLSCTNCPSPLATPKRTTAYLVTAGNKYGCTASDTVLVKLSCSQDRVRIPNVFTPDNNGKNDASLPLELGFATVHQRLKGGGLSKGRGMLVVIGRSIVLDKSWYRNAYDCKNMMKMYDNCTECGQPLEPEVGFYYGTGFIRMGGADGPAGVWRHVLGNGQQFYMQICLHRIRYNTDDAVMVIAQNVTEKLELERKLADERNARQQELTGAIITAQENERAEIGRELHDNVNQVLGAARIVQEQLNNIIKHANANNIAVALSSAGTLQAKGYTPEIITALFMEKIHEIQQSGASMYRDNKIIIPSWENRVDEINIAFSNSLFGDLKSLFQYFGSRNSKYANGQVLSVDSVLSMQFTIDDYSVSAAGYQDMDGLLTSVAESALRYMDPYNLATYFLNNSKFSECRQLTQSLLNDNDADNDGLALHLNGVSYMKQRDTATAKKLFVQALNKIQSPWLTYNNLGIVYIQEEKLDSAKMMYSNAIRLRPESFPSWLNFANLMYAQYKKSHRMGSLDSALNYYRKAVALNKNQTLMYVAMLPALYDKEGRASMETAMNKMIEMDPDNILVYVQAAKLFNSKGLATDAAIYYEKAKAHCNGDSIKLVQLAYYYKSYGQ